MNEYLPNGMLGLAITGLMASFMAGVAANVSAFNTVVTTDIVEPYVRPGRATSGTCASAAIATIGGIVVAMGTALIASTYDNLMNYVQALFSIFNAPLFATFIIGMFWRRMTPAGGLLGPRGGHGGGGGTWIGYKAGWFEFGSDLSESMWGAGAAFIVDAIVTVAVSLGPAQAGQRAAGPRLRDGERGRVRRPPAAPLVGVAEAARRHRPGGCHPPHDHLLVGAHVRTDFHHERRRARRAANLFDLRRVIGGLFVAYGLLLADPRAVRQRRRHRARRRGSTSTSTAASPCSPFGLLMLALGLHAPAGDELTEARGSQQRAAPRGSTRRARVTRARPPARRGSPPRARRRRARVARARRRRSRRRPSARRPPRRL